MTTTTPDREERSDDESRLSNRAITTAATELREDPSTKQQALSAIKHWIERNPDLAHIRTDSNFLLRFLRVKKFSQPLAQDMLLKYLNLRQTFPHFCMKLDCLDPKLSELIDNGYLFASPERDQKGRRVIIGIASRFDPFKYDCRDMGRMHCLTYEALLDEEESQILGFTHFGDLRGVSTAHVTLWSPAEFAVVFKWGEQSVPMRHKQVHCINFPTPLKYVYDLIRTRLSKKLQDRFMIHSSMSELHSNLDPKVLPKEYGGIMPMSDMIALWKKELDSKRDSLLELDKMLLLDNKCITKKHDRNNNNSKRNVDLFALNGSFRKLEVD